jgi:hypothetical protein
MSTVVSPIHDAGSVSFTESVTRYYSSIASIVAIAADPSGGSAASLGIEGERADYSLAAYDIEGEGVDPGYGSIDTGAVPDNQSYATLDEGDANFDPASGSLGIEGEGVASSPSVLEVGMSPSITGMYMYQALGSLGSKAEALSEALGSADLSGERVSESRSVLAVKGDRETPGLGTLEVAEAEAGIPALASLETGTPSEATEASRASADIRTGESVDFLVDIQDEILSSGHGDC